MMLYEYEEDEPIRSFSVKRGDLVELHAPQRLHGTFNELLLAPTMFGQGIPGSRGLWFDRDVVGIIVESRSILAIFGKPTLALRLLTPIGIGWTSLRAISGVIVFCDVLADGQ